MKNPEASPNKNPAESAQPPKQKAPRHLHTYRVAWPVVFILIIIAMVGLGAWSYTNANKLQSQLSAKEEALNNKQKALDDANAAKAKAEEALTTVSADSDYVTITEWGVKFKPGSDLADAVYYVVDGTKSDPPNANISTSYFVSQSLLVAMQPIVGLDCSIFSAPLGTIVRYKNATDIPSVSGPKSTKKIGDYTYAYYHPQAVFCSSNASVSTVATKQTTALEAAFSTLLPAQ